MIKLESAHIEEVRGIRKLDIKFDKGTFAISGPNGSGKSGVIDAIEFGLTGQIGRLMGRGTKGLSVAEHGPHVDKTKFPDAAFVTLKVFLPALGKSATITRKVSAPKKPKIEPADADIKAALDEIADHPEITLSRREILRFILVEPAKRSEEIQSILKLDEIGQRRAVLNTAQNKVQALHKGAISQVQASRDTLLRHLQIASLQAADLLSAVNIRRQALGLTIIENLTVETKLDLGLSETGKTPALNKQAALRELEALATVLGTIQELGAEPAFAILSGLARLEADPALLEVFQRRSLIEKGLDLLDGPTCPLCDSTWDSEDLLREHLRTKFAKSEEAGQLRHAIMTAGAELGGHVTRLKLLIGTAQGIAKLEDQAVVERLLREWTTDLDELKATLPELDGLMGLKSRLSEGWPRLPEKARDALAGLISTVKAKPDQTAILDAQTFLSTAQLRLDDYRSAMRGSKAAEVALKAAKATYEAYCDAMEGELNALYEDVQADFSAFYRAINEDDEVRFTAKLTPSEGRLDFNVNFYERGLFPPGAFHSEGHQDGMGVCLYLALMKRLFGDRFTIALLDDVVMSIDTNHRYQFCKLLKTQFPGTQFVITTHDRVWAAQMKAAGLVTAKASLAFYGWTVDTGPLVEASAEIWNEIDAALAKGKVEIAAAALRNHLEYVARHLADSLGARPSFRADGDYELGELLSSVLTRIKDLYGKAAVAAQSWGNAVAQETAAARKADLATASAATNVEQWAVNKAVHYNEWANFGRRDFEPVVAAFKGLLRCVRCDGCEAWLYVSPRGVPESLRCACNGINLNLKQKPK